MKKTILFLLTLILLFSTSSCSGTDDVEMEYLITPLNGNKLYNCSLGRNFILPDNHKNVAVTFTTANVFVFTDSIADALSSPPFGSSSIPVWNPVSGTFNVIYDTPDIPWDDIVDGFSSGLDATIAYFDESSDAYEEPDQNNDYSIESYNKANTPNGITRFLYSITGATFVEYEIKLYDYNNNILGNCKIPIGETTICLSENVHKIRVTGTIDIPPDSYAKSSALNQIGVTYGNLHTIETNQYDSINESLPTLPILSFHGNSGTISEYSINSDGTFNTSFYNYSLEESYVIKATGSFNIVKDTDYSYSLRLDHYEISENIENKSYEGILKEGDIYTLYLPNIDVTLLPENVLESYKALSGQISADNKTTQYILYNPNIPNIVYYNNMIT